ncbi:MAG: hypothetical protein Harvfovirus1_42 [Harvfovirus sp.]|uniref:Uncharacterized protein n=1 Tax=Harvfovirus sp. TaxID=2487768 RepID=A0A3G4ZZR8_9VIRU|nr:MAG: hypothetical protein Harvfovirus1_42 [Harvfovirus sp.]
MNQDIFILMEPFVLGNKSSRGKYLLTMTKAKVEVKTNTLKIPVIVSKADTIRWDYSGMIDYYVIKLILPENVTHQSILIELYDLISKSIKENYSKFLSMAHEECKDDIFVDLSMAGHSLIKTDYTGGGNIIIDLCGKIPDIEWNDKCPNRASFCDIFKVNS